MAGDHEEEHYHPKDALKGGVNAALQYGGVGLFAAAIQSAVQRTAVGPFATFTRFGGTISTFTFVGGTYEFARLASANLRQKEDPYNTAIGGFLGGSIIGLRTRKIPVVLGWGTAVAVILATFDFTGNSLRGWGHDDEEDAYDKKERLRKNRRRPMEETIAELGEGRGIYPPGYEQRRRQRLKEKYGVEVVDAPSADPNQAASS